MKEKVTAKVYAQTFISLGEEKGVDIASEFTTLTETINSSNDLENVLFLDVFTLEEKVAVYNQISAKLKLSSLTNNIVHYLFQEKRIALFPLIFKEVIVIDDDKKGFIRGVIEGPADTITDDHKNKLVSAIKAKLDGKQPRLDYVKNSDITAGFKITINDHQLDATLDNKLRSFKELSL